MTDSASSENSYHESDFEVEEPVKLNPDSKTVEVGASGSNCKSNKPRILMVERERRYVLEGASDADVNGAGDESGEV